MRGFKEVKQFQRDMLATFNLSRHKAKGPTRGVPLHVFRKGYEEERREVVQEVDAYYHAGGDTEAQLRALKRIQAETADVGCVAALAHAEAGRLIRELEEREVRER